MEGFSVLKGVVQKTLELAQPLRFAVKVTEWNLLAGSLSDQGAFPKVSPELLSVENRYPRIVQILKELDSDLYFLHECDFFEKLETDIGDAYECYFHKKQTNPDGSVILFKKSLRGKGFGLEVSQEKRFQDENGQDVSQGFQRASLSYTDQTGNSEKLLEMINTHLKAKKPNHQIRLGQIKQILNAIEEEESAIIVGDLNADPEEEGIQLIKDSGFVKSIESDTHFTSYKLRKTVERRQIDYIWLKSSGNCQFSSVLDHYELDAFDHEVALPNEWNPSDHLPIFATICFF